VIFLRLDTDPVRYLYRTADVLPHLPPKSARHQLLVELSPLQSEVDGENTHLSATLSKSMATSVLLAIPPLGATVTALDEEDVEHFVGRVQAVELSDDGCLVSLEA
jgi:hypothetical protein